MAGEAKITKKIIDETADILKAVPEDKIDDVAAKLGVDAELVTESLKNPKSSKAKEFFTTSLEKVGKSLQGMQDFVDQAMGRAKEEAIELGTKRDIGLGGKPPAVQSEFKTEGLGKERGYTTQTPIGEPLVPVSQPGRLQTVASKLGKAEAVDVDFDPVTGAPMSVVGKKEPLALPARGKTSMPSGRESLAEGMEEVALPKIPTGVEGLPSAKKVGAAAAGLGLGTAGAVLFGKGFSGDETAPPVVKEAGVEDAADVKTVVGTIPETAMPAEQKQTLEKQVDDFTAAVKSFEQRMAAEQDSAKKEKDLKEGRLEFMRALETIMHGVVSALGANAMLNRGSPFAIDFSKGPQTDWASEFDRLQKNYDSQLNGIRSRYGLAIKEKAEQRAEAQAAARESRVERELQLKEREIGIKEQKEKEQQAAKQATALTKLSAADQKTYKENLSFYGDLRKAIAEKKPGPAQDAATKLGADEATLKNLEAAMSQGLISKALSLVGLSKEPDTEQILQGLRPQKPGQAEAAPAETEQERKERRRQELLRKARGE